MSLTLSEAAKLSNDVLLKGVIETVVKESVVLQKLPFANVNGNSLTYNRENVAATAAFYDVGDTWVESTPTFTQLTATLRILGGDADVDNYIKATRQNIQDIEAAVIELKSKAVRHKFEDTFIYGNNATNSKEWSGIRKLIDCETASNQVIAMAATGATLTLAKLDQAIDAVKPGKPDLLLMSRRSRRKITALMRALSSIEVSKNEFGDYVELYNGIPLGISDAILDTHTLVDSVETATTGGASSTIYAVKFGEGAVLGIQGAGGMQVERLGSLETKDASRTRIKWYCAIADFSVLARAALIGVQD
ncbi:MAG: phage major capsid protein [Chloroflexi bacterium]|nr:phage major capsid protein [Chloroflexota bacterium]